MILNGTCSPLGIGQWSHTPGEYNATKVSVSYAIDPFSASGQAWLTRLRDAIQKVGNSDDVGTWYMYGEAANQMDISNMTFDRVPLMVGLMMCVVLAIIGFAFKSVVAPIRAVLCLMWMLVVTFGFSVFVFQDGCLDFLGMSQLGRRSDGAMNWISPCVALSVVVGLGLDYDIFYSERVSEECEHGYPLKEASVRALAATANTISAAGIIMVVAFLSLLLSSTPTLNEIAFLLIVGIVIDCLITTKVIIPAVLMLLGRFSFWPRRFHIESQRGVSLAEQMIAPEAP
eukprot:TRINITY_DN34100_c0_g1_i10.p1 TRINITY_DN34100_c0_g1~~TRINITY_DN34100_c0_g1_i10.p1  ORF type:complete len:286 (+),score=19.69 TRINITY_DN34100_c0_g1_i10:331-1188(+)